MLPGMEDWKNLKDEWGGKCLSLHQRAAYLVWSPILSIYHFFRDSINEGPFSEHERERAVTLPLHPERQGLFNDVIWACLGASLCRTCPFHSPNHLPLWFFFSWNFSTGWGIPESLGWEERSFLKCSIDQGYPHCSHDTAKAPSLEGHFLYSRDLGARVDSAHYNFYFFLSLSIMTAWHCGTKGQGLWWSSQLWHGREQNLPE